MCVGFFLRARRKVLFVQISLIVSWNARPAIFMDVVYRNNTTRPTITVRRVKDWSPAKITRLLYRQIFAIPCIQYTIRVNRTWTYTKQILL